MHDIAPIIQTLSNFLVNVGEALLAAVQAVWERDELLLLAIIVLLFQAAWILRLRHRLRRFQSQHSKPKGEGQHPAQNGGPRHTWYANVANKVRFRSRPKGPSVVQ